MSDKLVITIEADQDLSLFAHWWTDYEVTVEGDLPITFAVIEALHCELAARVDLDLEDEAEAAVPA